MAGLVQLIPLVPVAVFAVLLARHEVRVAHRNREVTRGNGLGPGFDLEGGRKR